MEKMQNYRIEKLGKKAERRNYSKVSGNLDLPDLVEVQTQSFEWFIREGIREVFEDIYPIQNYGGNIRLKFVDYEFGTPKYTVNECKYREANFAAPLKAKMELEMVDNTTGEVLTKWEDVFLGEFPMMTETGTFIINGAERVIVSQIVRSPGADVQISFLLKHDSVDYFHKTDVQIVISKPEKLFGNSRGRNPTPGLNKRVKFRFFVLADIRFQKDEGSAVTQKIAICSGRLLPQIQNLAGIFIREGFCMQKQLNRR